MKKAKFIGKRIFSMLLALMMLCTLEDISAFAQAADSLEPQSWGADVSAGDVISFGSYPQTELSGSALTDEIVNAQYDSNGDAEIGGERYRRIKGREWVKVSEYNQYVQEHYPDGVTYDQPVIEECENAKIEREGTYRYFKWEPVKWKVLKNEKEEGTLFVMADQVLDAVDYYNHSNGVGEALWKDCTLRKWLNSDETGFYHTAFNAKEKDAVKVNAGNPEGDRIYLLSEEEAKNPEYGFENTDGQSAGRKMEASAYAAARGASVIGGGNYACSWFLRTPGKWQYVKNIDFSGKIWENIAIYHSQYLLNPGAQRYERTFEGCVPAMHIDASFGIQEPEPGPDPTPDPEPKPEPEPKPTGDASSSDKSVLKSLNFDIPEDSAYKQDEVYTGTRSVSTMSELVLTKAGAPGSSSKIYIYDNDKNKGIRDNLNASQSVTSSYLVGDSMNPYTITETVDADGNGKKELLVQLYLNGTKKGREIMMTLSDLKTGTCLFSAQPTGGYISTTDDIPPYGLEGLLSMCAGDFDGDGCEEIAVYTPNNQEETASGSTPDTLQIKIYKLGSAPTKLAEPQQVIEIARVGSGPEDCQEWLYSHSGSKKQYYCLPYMQLTAGDADQDGIDDLLTVASFSTIFRGSNPKNTVTWKQLLNPNTCFGSVLDVYTGQHKESEPLKQAVKKRVLVGRDSSNNNDWNKGCGVLRNASVTIANVTGADTNEIVLGGNYTGVAYTEDTKENTTVTKNRYVWVDDGDDPKTLVGYVSAQGLFGDNSAAASLSYNWTIQENAYDILHYYNGDGNSMDPGNDPVALDGFAAYGCEQPDTIALQGQLFTYSEDDNKLKCNSYKPPSDVGKNKSNVWVSSQIVGNVTNDPFGRETLYFTSCQKRSKKEDYWNDIVSVWGVVNADGTKGYDGKCISDSGQNTSAKKYTLAMCDIDDDSSVIKYEAGNTDVYYSNVQLLSVLQAAPVYGELGDDYVSGAETSYGKSSGSSSGAGHTHQVSAGVIAGFEHEVSFLGLANILSIEVTGQLAVTAGWEFEKTVGKEFTTSYNTSGTEDVAVLYTVPYVRYNGQIYIPDYTLPTKEEYEAKKSFCQELKKNIERYQDIKAAVVGGTYSKPKDGYNNEYTTDVTKNSYDYQLRTFQNYMEWLAQTESQMEGFEGSEGLPWGQKMEGGWEDYFFCVPQTPIITSVSAGTYDEIAAGCKDLQTLYGTALPRGYEAGRPETYASNVGDLKERTTAEEESIESGKTNAGESGDLGDGFISSTAISASSSAPSQTIAFTKENAKSNSIGSSASLEVDVTISDIKGGIAFSAENAATFSSSTTEGCEFSGQVPNLPVRPDYMTQEQYSNYDYGWKLVAYDAAINGSKVPVVGYYTKYANRSQIPPSAPQNLELEDVQSESITLTWSEGSRAADHYNLYQVSGSGANKIYDKAASVPASEGKEGVYRYTHEGLKPSQSYTYVAVACNADESIVSVYSEEVTTTTPVPDFDVAIKLEGINSGETYLAGTKQTLTASLSTKNYPQSEIEQYIWQINDGSGWQKLPDGADQNSYTWEALSKSDGCQYRCSAYVAVDNRLYRLYSDAVTLHVRKAEVQVDISADKKEGATDRSSEFGVAVYNGDVLKLAARVAAEEGVQPNGSLVFVITSQENASNVREYSAEVSETGSAEIECRFSKAGRYAITARYAENERIKEAVSVNTLPYYAYDASQKEERAQGQDMEDTIYQQKWDDLTVENAIGKKEEIQDIKTNYDTLTDGQKEFVETNAKNQLEHAVDHLQAAEAAEKMKALVLVTEEHAVEYADAITAAKEAYDLLTEKQQALVPAAVKNILETAQEAYKKATEPEDPVPTPTPEPGPEPGPGEQVTPSDGTEKFTPEQKKEISGISGKLGVDEKTAVIIWKLADRMNIDMDTLLLTEKDILAVNSEKEVKGSKFGKLRAQSSKVSSSQVKLKWTKCKGADGYLIYRAQCGKKNPYKLVKEIKKGSAKGCTLKKLKKGKGYHFLVRAYKTAGGKKITVSASKAVHIVTKGGKKVNIKGVKAGKSKVVLKKGKTLKLKASVIKQNKPIAKCRKICYESSDTKIAAVAKNGTVKAKAKGKCTIYVYAQNGLYKQVKITVK